ncbi:uncharacterized protein N7459_008048 [Penicillium hispanicum]|uniref:uncharacterized protein n=1 Tax=Penicillium hispanicum TaxID=1080232 RepID=UPI0025407F22|nr:uncharacterized protein N7459_008048 [Penicillium hispanicum]KAJ5573621.1 hypothetical protein N7459_008048 [Penicillium hispanicum]
MGVAPGALAGAVVASVLGTAILCLFTSFLYFRHKRNQSNIGAHGEEAKGEVFERTRSGGHGNGSSHHSVPMGRYTSLQRASGHQQFPIINIAEYATAPVDDDTVASRLLTVFDQASLHVENFYAPAASPAWTPNTATLIAPYQSPHLPAPLENLLSTPKNQRAILTHTLIRTLSLAMQPGCEGDSLLPPAYASSPRPQASRCNQEQELFAWRMLTVHLHENESSPQSVTQTTKFATRLAEAFTSAFAPYSDLSLPEDKRVAHLIMVAKAAAEAGAWLFTQPCTFRFVWSDSSATGEITTLPAIVKANDEYGRRLSSDQVVAGATKGLL